MKIMYELLLVLIAILLVANYTREHYSLPGWAGGYELANISIMGEDTCKPGQEKDAGLCYTKCRDGYNGVGPVCWAKSEGVGIGTPIGLEPCPDGWYTEGLICREPLGWNSRCVYWGLGNWSGCATGGRLKGRLDGGGICPGPGGGDDHTERIAGLCYRKCPKELPARIPGMPYLCYKGGELAYGRGVGTIPQLLRLFGKYTFL
jgi:hypothetical protein